MPEEVKAVETPKAAEPVQTVQGNDITRVSGAQPIGISSVPDAKALAEVDDLRKRISGLEKDVEGKQGRIDSLTAEKYDLKEKATQTSTKKWEDLSLDELKTQRTLARQDPESTEGEIDKINDLIHEKIATSKANTEVGTAENKFLKQQANREAFKEVPELFNADGTFVKDSDVYRELAKLYNEFPDTVKNDPAALLKLGRIAKNNVALTTKVDNVNVAKTNEDLTKNGLEGSGFKKTEPADISKIQEEADSELHSRTKGGPKVRALIREIIKE